jgi:hypothetical protein
LRLLLLSNGHGEDAVGALLVQPLRAQGFAPHALPIVGEGHAYRALDVPLLGPMRAMPSGGFVYGRPAALAGDLRAGLARLTVSQLQALRAARGAYPWVVAIGDVVPLLYAWLYRAPFVFVGCAKSDLYLGGRPGAYLSIERWALRRPACRAVWPRDATTTRNLRAAGVAADWLGNPMMDGLAPTGQSLPGDPAAPTVLLLPGSRSEAVVNLQLLRAAARAIAADEPRTRFLVALAPQADPADFDAPELHLLPGRFADAAHAARLALAMAGTATEQVVGLGLPVISLPGAGPQFTPAFAEAQTRLLGESVTLLPPDPARVAAEARALLADPDRLARIAANGRARMGPPGASARTGPASRRRPSRRRSAAPAPRRGRPRPVPARCCKG